MVHCVACLLLPMRSQLSRRLALRLWLLSKRPKHATTGAYTLVLLCIHSGAAGYRPTGPSAAVAHEGRSKKAPQESTKSAAEAKVVPTHRQLSCRSLHAALCILLAACRPADCAGAAGGGRGSQVAAATRKNRQSSSSAGVTRIFLLVSRPKWCYTGCCCTGSKLCKSPRNRIYSLMCTSL